MSLKVVRRPKSPNWIIRGTVAGQYIEESSGTSDRVRAEFLRSKRENELLDRHVYGAKKTATFAEAVISYIQAGGEKRFIRPLLEYFRDKPLSGIRQANIDQAAETLYPGASHATWSRQVYTPMIAVMRRAARAELCDPVQITRPKVKRKPVQVPPDDWWEKVQAECSPNLWAILTFLSNTGARVSEALRLDWDAVDFDRGEALLGRTKNGDPRLVTLNARVIEALAAQRQWQAKEERWQTGKVFNFAGRSNVYRSLRGACERAGAPYFPTHPAGRHTFAARGLKAGWNLKLLQEAGGWESIAMPAQNYGHLEKSQVREAVLGLGENPGKKRKRAK